MGWLVALVAVVIFVWLLVRFPRAVVLTVGGIVAIIIFWVMSEKQREAKSHSLIAPSQLDLTNVTLSSYGWGKISGTIKNNSVHTLKNLTFKVTVRDCVENSACVVIGENDAYVSVIIPPSQLRSFEGSVFFSDMPKPNKATWSYQIIEITAE
jgi:hypothetical protein